MEVRKIILVAIMTDIIWRSFTRIVMTYSIAAAWLDDLTATITVHIPVGRTAAESGLLRSANCREPFHHSHLCIKANGKERRLSNFAL